MTYRHPPANTTEPGVITLAGDLGGTEASPTVLRINGISVSSTASANQVLVTTSSSATTWAQIVDAYVSATAAISGTKINPNFGSQGISTSGTLSVGGATVTSLQDTGLGTGIVHSDSSGNFTSSLIVNADVSATAAIAGSKISPNFGTQALTAGTFSLGTTTSANSIFGSLTYTVKTFSGNGTIDTTTNDLLVYADTSSAPFTLTLPAPTTGRFLIIKDKKQTFGTNNLTISPHAGEKIDGVAASVILATNNEEDIFTSDGTDWYTSIFAVSISGAAGGDLSGTYPNPTVAKINGASVPAAGSLTTGNVLQVNGASSLTYAPVNLGGGANFVTGTLPAGNQAAQTMSGDVTGTTAANTVVSLTGSAGTVSTASSTTTIQFNSGSSAPTINQASTSSASGQALTINAQNATGATHNGGNLILAGGTSGAATAGTVQLQTAGSTRLTASATGVITIVNLGTGVVHADSSGNLTSSTIVDADVSATANIAVSKLASGTTAQVLLNNSTPTPTWTTLTGDVTVTSAGATTVNAISGATPIVITPSELQWKNTTTSPLIDQAANTSASGVGQQFTIQSQSATGTHSTGGNLILASGNGTDSDGYVAIETGMVERLVVNANGVVQINNLSTGVVHADSSGNLTSSLIVNADVSASAAIAYSKLNLSNSIVNADVNSAAAIAYSKLNLTNSIVNADINTAAAIAGSKISPNFGTQALTAGTFSLGTSTSANSLFGSITFTTKTFNTTGTIDTTTTDMLIYADTSGGAFNLTLPTPTTGRTLIVKDKKQSFGTNNLTIVRSGSEKIDGVAASLILATNNEEVIFTSDGTDWYTSLFAESTTGAAGGDLSGTYPNPTVAKINGATVPAAGSLTTGNVLQVNGSSSLTYAAVNLAGGNNFVTGVLPTGNQAAQSLILVGDVTGSGTTTSTTTTVAAISGSSPIVITPSELRFASATSSPLIDQADNTGASGIGQQFTIRAQNATGTHSFGGNLILASGNGTDSDGYVAIETGQVERLVVNASGVVQINNLSTGVVHSDGSGNLTSSNIVVGTDITPGTADQLLDTNHAGTAAEWFTLGGDATFASHNLTLANTAVTPGTYGDGTHVGQFTVDSKGRLTFATNVTITGAAPTGAAGGDLNGTYPNPTVQSLNGATTIQIGNTASTTNTVQFASAVSTPTIDQAQAASGAGTSLTVQAQQGATSGNQTGGALNLSSGSGGGSGTAGNVVVQTGGTTRLTANANGVITIANLGTGVVHADSSGNLTSSTIVNADVSATAAIVVSKLASGTADQLLDTNHAGTTTEWFTAGGDVTFASHNFTVVAISGASPIPITPAVLQWTAGTSSPTINQAAPTATNTPAAGQTLLINSQAGTAAVSGNNNGGAGGIAELLGGTGGTPTGTATGGAGGVSEVVGGTGGLASSTSGSTGGNGGQAELLGGTGGAGNGSGTTGGTGGAITVDAGAGGAAGGGTAGGNGAVSIGATNAASIGIGRSGITTTITGGLTQLTGAVSLTGNAASSFTTSSSTLTLDASTTLNLGTSTATAVSVSKSGVTTTVNGALTVTQATTLNNSLTQSGGAVSLTGNAASSFTTTSSTLSLDATTALNLGTSTATSVAIGRSGITTTVTGGLSQQTGALNLTANAGSQITTSSGLLTITAAAASTWSTSAGALTLTSAAAATWSTSAGVLSLSGNTGVNLQTNTTTIAKVDSNKFYTVKGYSQNVTIKTHSNNPYTVLATDNIIAADVSGGVLTVTLPSAPAVGDTYAVKDYKGAAATSNITVDSGSGNQIDAAQTFVMDVNYQSITVVCVATSPNQWMQM